MATAWKFLVTVSLAVLPCALLACGAMPLNFDSLSLDEQIDAYSRYVQAREGMYSFPARAAISLHGWPAADRMAESLEGLRPALPPVEALAIIARVQERGCSLKGTKADTAVTHYLQECRRFARRTLR